MSEATWLDEHLRLIIERTIEPPRLTGDRAAIMDRPAWLNLWSDNE